MLKFYNTLTRKKEPFKELKKGLVTIYSCGPKAMLKAVSDIAIQKKIDCQVSMEARMACGIGTCLGCVIKTKNGYKKVCNDGPVFNANDVVF